VATRSWRQWLGSVEEHIVQVKLYVIWAEYSSCNSRGSFAMELFSNRRECCTDMYNMCYYLGNIGIKALATALIFGIVQSWRVCMARRIMKQHISPHPQADSHPIFRIS